MVCVVAQTTVDAVMEFATPLLSLYEMHDGGLAGLSAPAMRLERDRFRQVLTRILSYKDLGDRCRDKYLIVDYRGTPATAAWLHIARLYIVRGAPANAHCESK